MDSERREEIVRKGVEEFFRFTDGRVIPAEDRDTSTANYSTRSIRHALSLAIPDGHVVVPVERLREMRESFAVCEMYCPACGENECAPDCWLAAAIKEAADGL